MTRRIAVILLSVIVLFSLGCSSGKDESVTVAKNFWKAMEDRDLEKARSYATKATASSLNINESNEDQDVEIIFGDMIPPDWTTAWRQCHRLGFKPKIATMGRALLFPSDIEAIGGNLPNGLSAEFWWGPTYPHKSSITGYSCKELCEAWEAETGKQWIQLLGFEYGVFEIAANVLNRVQTLNKEKIRDGIASTDLDTIVGHIKYNKQNYATTPIVGAQWGKGKKWPWELRVVWNGPHKEIPTQGKMMPNQ